MVIKISNYMIFYNIKNTRISKHMCTYKHLKILLKDTKDN